MLMQLFVKNKYKAFLLYLFMSLIKEYFDLTKKYINDYGQNTILLMQVGSFFEVYGILDKKTGIISGSNIEDFSRICELNVVEKNVCVSNATVSNATVSNATVSNATVSNATVSNATVSNAATSENKENVVMAGFKDMMIEKYLKKIQEAGFTAVVFTQDEAAKNTTRSCAGIFSPGTYFPNEITTLTNNICCVWVDLVHNKVLLKGKHIVVGIANIDIYTGKSNIFQFKEAYTNNPTDFDQLEHFISIYKPSELILISNLTDHDINNIIHYANIHCPSIHKMSLSSEANLKNQFTKKAENCEKQNYQKEILQKFYKIEDYAVFSQNFYENNVATQAFCFLLDFVYQHNPHLVNRISEPIFENCSDRLLLANHSLKQLNIIDDRENTYAGKYSSVLKMLNICLTSMGKRKFSHLFLSPSTNKEHLQREYDMTEYLLKDYDTFTDLFKQKLGEIRDLSKWERQIFLKKINPKSFVQMYKNLETIAQLFQSSEKDENIISYLNKNSSDKNVHSIPTFISNIKDYLKERIDMDLAKDIDQTTAFEINFIRKGVNSELDLKTEKIQDCENKLEAIRNYLSILIENKEKKSKTMSDYVKTHETEKNCFSLITTNRRCKLLQDALPEQETIVKLAYVNANNRSESFDFKVSKKQFDFPKQSAANSFIQDEQITQLCKSISYIKITMKDEITSVFQQMVDTFGEKFQKPFETIVQYVTLLDVIFTKATLAKKYNYCKPSLVESDKSFVKIKNLRHCLIEFLQTNENYVTNDISLGDGITDGILLYGTNAVGKTSLIRALGISIVMAQSGLFVPCSQFTFKPYHSIFTRIIGNDNIFKGLSTFAVEMSELRTILRLTDQNSLVLGDELCSGTENSSAISIFVAGIQKLRELKCSFIFATHLHEIVNYDEIRALTNVSLKHMSVIYDKERDMLIYDRKLKDGPGNNMYGLEVCKSLHLPQDFIDAAYEIRAKYNNVSATAFKCSHYNAKKIVGMCEKCGEEIGTEVHHLQHQKEANDAGFIESEDSVFHKNKLANLMTLCETCHHEFHKKNLQHKRVKTSKGYQLKEL